MGAIYHSIDPKWGLYVNMKKRSLLGGNWLKFEHPGIEPRRVVYIYVYIYICNVYMGCWWDLYDSIAPKPRIFSFEVKKCPRARPAA